jgi:hypothetical protein
MSRRKRHKKNQPSRLLLILSTVSGIVTLLHDVLQVVRDVIR